MQICEHKNCQLPLKRVYVALLLGHFFPLKFYVSCD
jgi:hypothetical protein